jgi:hypothetical protein
MAPSAFHRFVGRQVHKITSQSQLKLGKPMSLGLDGSLFALRPRSTEVALIPSDVWDALLDEVALLGDDRLAEMTGSALIVDVTTDNRLGLGPAAELLGEAGISKEVLILGMGPYLLLQAPNIAPEAPTLPISELWDHGWDLVRRRRANRLGHP